MLRIPYESVARTPGQTSSTTAAPFRTKLSHRARQGDLHISAAKGKTMVEPHSPPNDVGRKAVSTIVVGIIHADIVEKFRQVDKTYEMFAPKAVEPINQLLGKIPLIGDAKK